MVAVCSPSVYVVGERRDLVVVRLIVVDRMYNEPFYTVTARGLADRVRKEDPDRVAISRRPAEIRGRIRPNSAKPDFVPNSISRLREAPQQPHTSGLRSSPRQLPRTADGPARGPPTTPYVCTAERLSRLKMKKYHDDPKIPNQLNPSAETARAAHRENDVARSECR